MTPSLTLRLAPPPKAALPAAGEGARFFAGRLFWAAILLMNAASPAFAQASGGFAPTTMLDNVVQFILGQFGQGLAVLGIIAIGLAWMFGRASLGLVAGVVGGIVIMFGASFLESALTSGSK